MAEIQTPAAAGKVEVHAPGFCGDISCTVDSCIEAELAAMPMGGWYASPAPPLADDEPTSDEAPDAALLAACADGGGS